jgi:hypothetical protein
MLEIGGRTGIDASRLAVRARDDDIGETVAGHAGLLAERCCVRER